MKHKFKRVLSLALVLCMIVSQSCISYASSGTDTETTAVEISQEAAETTAETSEEVAAETEEAFEESSESEEATEEVTEESAAEETEEVSEESSESEEATEEVTEESATEETEEASEESTESEKAAEEAAEESVAEETEEASEESSESEETTEEVTEESATEETEEASEESSESEETTEEVTTGTEAAAEEVVEETETETAKTEAAAEETDEKTTENDARNEISLASETGIMTASEDYVENGISLVSEVGIMTTSEDYVKNGISLASEDDGIATVSDDSDATESVTVYTGETTTETFTSTDSELATSSSTNITDADDNVIATYTIAKTSSYTKYSSYSASGSKATSLNSDSSYAIGNGSYYLAVDANGNLSVVDTLSEYSVWTVTSQSSTGMGGTTTYTYTLYNEATGYYLAFTESSSSGGDYGDNNTSYTALTTSTSSYSFSWDSNVGFYKSVQTRTSSGDTTTYYYFTVSSSGATFESSASSSTTGASSYSVTGTNGTTTYTYTITFNGVTAGTGSVTINGTTYNVTVKTKKTISVVVDGETVTLNQSYGWHIANIETLSGYTFAVAASKQSLESEFEYTDGGVTAQYTTSTGTPPNNTTTTTTYGTIYGYDADVYYSDYSESEKTYSGLNVTVYGSNTSGTGEGGTELSMTVSKGTDTITMPDGNSGEGGVYTDNTIYDYDYITIVPAAGYYVSNVVIACNATIAAMSGSPYYETNTVTSFTNECGNTDYFGVYGVGCFQMSSSNLTSTSYSPTEGTSVELDMASWISSHAEDTGAGDPYFILIEIEKIPTPLYVEYEAGNAATYVSNSTIVSIYEDYYWATESAGDNVSFALTSDDLTAINYLYTVLDPLYTTYMDDDGTVYYFAGWEVEYFTTAEDTEDTAGNATYPTLSGTVTLASGTIDYGSGTTLYLFTHVKLVAKWTTNKGKAAYVVDFGLPMELNLINTLGTKNDGGTLDDDYDWTVTAISSYPTYGTPTIASDGSDVTYTLTKVMDGTDTMLLWLTGTPSSDTNTMNIYGVVEVTIYPATTVYYEEGFATYGTTWSVDTESENGWTTGSTGSGTQETHVANVEGNSYNNYGYDEAYANTTGASNSTQAATEIAADSLSFSFTGTGVDIYANCTSSTGAVLIRVVKNTTTTDEYGNESTTSTFIKMLTVDTSDVGSYASTDNTSYNTPIASVTGLAYGNYTVTMYVYSAPFNFDGFRVYDTISQSKTEDDADYTVQTTVYYNDDEDYPVYTEIRDVVLTALIGSAEEGATITEDYVNSMTIEDAQVYASSDSGVAVYYSTGSYTWSELVGLMDDGAKNELYLPAGTTLVLELTGTALDTDDDGETSPRTIQIGVKTTSGTGTVKLNLDGGTVTEKSISSVDMFYEVARDVSESNGTTTYTVTITNPSATDAISLTKLKASDDVSISDEAITESEMTALLTGTEETKEEEETAVFEPETFTVSTSVKTSSKTATVTVTAKASEDVESITVNGTEVTGYKTVTERSGWGKNATTTTYRQFTYTETVSNSGTYTYEVSAVNADGVASTATTATAAVSIQTTGNKR